MNREGVLSEIKWRFRHYQLLDSTNEEAKRLIDSGETEFLVVSTEHQTRGRGRRDNAWYDAAGKSLLLSVVLKDDFFPINPSLCVPVGCVMALKNLGAKGPKIKWTNDLVYGRKKVGGILIEKVARNRGVFLIVGIGINMDYTDGELPKTPGLPPTAIAIEEGRSCEKSEIIEAVLNSFESMKEMTDEQLLLCYRRHLAFLGEKVRVKSPVRYPPLARPESEVHGILEGVDEQGKLILKESNGGIVLLIDGRLLPADLENPRLRE